jgi:hypothetical protein
VAKGNDNGQPNGHALFEAANKLRGSVESAEYKHLVLGLIFLKYISDAFEQRRAALEAELSDAKSKEYVADPVARAEELDDRDAYAEKRVFWVPEQARWPAILASASRADIAKRIDDALSAIEGENQELRRMLPRVYSRAPLSADLLGSLVDTIAKIGFGKDPSEARDILAPPCHLISLLPVNRLRLRSAARSGASSASTSTSHRLRRLAAGVSRTSTTLRSSCSTKPRLSIGTGQTSRAGCSNRAQSPLDGATGCHAGSNARSSSVSNDGAVAALTSAATSSVSSSSER